jgi:hypothetical protein
MNSLIEVRILINKPPRPQWHYTMCWQREDGKVQQVGREGWWDFPEGKCSDFLGYGPAEVIATDLPEERFFEADRFEDC